MSEEKIERRNCKGSGDCRSSSFTASCQVRETRTIANVGIHVEHVIGNVRQKYSIPLPIHYVIKRDGEECPIIDRIVRVYCALCNVCDSVVPKKCCDDDKHNAYDL